MAKNKKILIIGAGIGGLASGCYAQMNGYDTEIFEMQDKPGGLCTAWERKGYTFDGCIHFLIGSKPGSVFHEFWQEVGALPGREILVHEEYMRFEELSGRTLVLYRDANRLQEHLLELSPDDRLLIRELTDAIRYIAKMRLPFYRPPEMLSDPMEFETGHSIRPFQEIMNQYLLN